jgi:putative phage-type endonuclease
MPITEKQRERRKKYLGSSDAAAVLGMDPFRSPYDVWADKTGRIEETGRDAADLNPAIKAGMFLENAILDWFATERNLPIIKNQARVHENGIMAASLDAIVRDDPTQALEAKSHGLLSGRISEEWGTVETDEVPERVMLQCQHQMAVVPTLQIVWVPALLVQAGLQWYRVERKPELISDLTEAEVTFWNEYVAKDIPPPDTLPSYETAKKLKRVAEKTISLAGEQDALIADWLAAKERLKEAEAKKKSTELALLAALGDAEAAESSHGLLTYLMGKPRAAYTVPEHPGFRTLRLKTTKEK